MLHSNFVDEHRGLSPVSEAGFRHQLVHVPPTEIIISYIGIVAVTSWKILEKFTDGIFLSICSVNSSVKSVHQQTLETYNVGEKLDKAQFVFLFLLKRK